MPIRACYCSNCRISRERGEPDRECNSGERIRVPFEEYRAQEMSLTNLDEVPTLTFSEAEEPPSPPSYPLFYTLNTSASTSETSAREVIYDEIPQDNIQSAYERFRESMASASVRSSRLRPLYMEPKKVVDHGCNPLCKECMKDPRAKVMF